MDYIITDNYETMSELAASYVIDLVNMKPDATIYFPTGGSTELMYELLVKANRDGRIDFSQVKARNLDEYFGLSSEHEASYRYFLNKRLFEHCNFRSCNIKTIKGNALNIEAEIAEYQEMINNDEIDLIIDGIGENGHIGFNEPSNSLNLYTHLEKLSASTIAANARFFDRISDVPECAITMGIADILKANIIMIISSGIKKSDVWLELNNKTVSTMLPASFLKLAKKITVILDKESAMKL